MKTQKVHFFQLRDFFITEKGKLVITTLEHDLCNVHYETTCMMP